MMTCTSIPADIYNPGHVFACLGFLEAAELLFHDVLGGFDATNTMSPCFTLAIKDDENPFGAVLKFLVEADIQEYNEKNAAITSVYPSRVQTWKQKRTSHPVLLSHPKRKLTVLLDHWTDGSGRNPFKLYAGNRTAFKIMQDMIAGNKTQKGIAALLRDEPERLIEDPLNVLTIMKGSFNFDPRGGWTAIDAGYSPNEHSYIQVTASPVVECMAAWGLSHARPETVESRVMRYGVWTKQVPPVLARAALGCAQTGIPLRLFTFRLEPSGKNKVVTYAEEEETS